MKYLFLTFLCLAVSFSSFSQNVYPNYIDGRVYVKFTKAAHKPFSKEDPKNISLNKMVSVKALISKYGISKATCPFYQANDDANLPDVVKLEFTQIQQIESIIAELKTIPGIEYAEKVSLMKTDATPNDFAISSASVHLTQINAQNAWNVFNGNSNITVAIVDNAVMWSHADLTANTYTNAAEASGTTGVDDDGNGYIDDINGFSVADNNNNANPTNLGMSHGTHCAGIAGARTDNASGIASIGWNIKLIPVQCEPDASGSTINVTYGYEGIIYATRAKAKIISCSWGNQVGSSITEQYAIDYAWNRGCIIVAAAGNAGNNTPNYPGAYNHVYCVTAVDASDVAWGLSCYGTWVDVAAPGVNIFSTLPYTGIPAYGGLSGTSMATPMVAGLAGLMLSKSPNMTRNDVLNCISTTAANIYTLGGNAGFAPGSQLGAGRIDAFAAMTCAASYSALPPVANFYAFPIFTCPNTNIPFYDSSLYVPTTWIWTFQGGTPATSTSSNPSVSWATAGNYSVSLTVSNANGSNSKTKLSYVNVSGPSALPFFEGFQANQFLPSGWSPNNIWNDNLYWSRATGVGGFGTSTACATFDNFNLNAPGDRDEMRSPKFSFANVATARLRFDVAYARYDAVFSDSLEVKVSTNCGTTWTSIYLKGGTQLATAPDAGSFYSPSSTQWRRDTIAISLLTAGQNNVMFSFINRGHYGQPIYLDNINLVFPTPTLSTTYASSICITNPSLSFTNSSASAGSYTWNFQGATPAISNATNPSVTYSAPGTYTLNLMGSNGTSTSSVTRTITVSSLPTISAGNASICAGYAATLQASGASTYTWNTGASGSSLVVSPISTINYTVNGSSAGCVATKIVSVLVSPSPTLVALDQYICVGGTATLSVNGAISYSWSTGAGSQSVLVNPPVTTVYTVTGFGIGCSTVKTLSVIINNPLSVISTSNANCTNACSGMANAASSGGAAPYSYVLTGASCNSLPCVNLCAGNYTLKTTDNTGCSSNVTFSITAPINNLVPVLSITNANCSSCNDGFIQLNTAGGTAPFTYSWLPSGGNGSTASNLLPGCYTLTIQDANGCLTSTSSCVGVNTGIADMTTNDGFEIYPNPAKNSIRIKCRGNDLQLNMYNNLGQIIINNKNIGSLTSIDLSEFASGVYVIEIKNQDQIFRKKLLVE